MDSYLQHKIKTIYCYLFCALLVFISINAIADNHFVTQGEWNIQTKIAANDESVRAFTYYEENENLIGLRIDRYLDNCDLTYISLQFTQDEDFNSDIQLENQSGQIRVDELNIHNVIYNTSASKGDNSLFIRIIKYDKSEYLYNEIKTGKLIRIKLTTNDKDYYHKFSLNGSSAALGRTKEICKYYSSKNNIKTDDKYFINDKNYKDTESDYFKRNNEPSKTGKINHTQEKLDTIDEDPIDDITHFANLQRTYYELYNELIIANEQIDSALTLIGNIKDGSVSLKYGESTVNSYIASSMTYLKLFNEKIDGIKDRKYSIELFNNTKGMFNQFLRRIAEKISEEILIVNELLSNVDNIDENYIYIHSIENVIFLLQGENNFNKSAVLVSEDQYSTKNYLLRALIHSNEMMINFYEIFIAVFKDDISSIEINAENIKIASDSVLKEVELGRKTITTTIEKYEEYKITDSANSVNWDIVISAVRTYKDSFDAEIEIQKIISEYVFDTFQMVSDNNFDEIDQTYDLFTSKLNYYVTKRQDYENQRLKSLSSLKK